MLFPENPERRPGLWDALEKQLAGTAMCHIVKNGIGNYSAQAEESTQDGAELTLQRLRRAQVCRVSASRGQPVSPHFAGRLESNAVFITEFLTTPSDDRVTVSEEKLKNDLEMAVIDLFFTEGCVNSVLVPLSISPWVMRDAEINVHQGGLIFMKRS